MSKVGNIEKKELELRKLRAETTQAEAESEAESLRLLRLKRTHAEEFDYKPEARGVFHFIGNVDSMSCAYFAEQVQRYAHLNPRAGIIIYIQSPGGYLLEGLGLYDTLRTLSSEGHHITTVVRGYAASMGAILLQAGDTRKVGKESHIMLHEVAAGTIGKLHEMKDDVKRSEMFNRRVMSILADRTDGKWTADSLYERIEAKDWWLSAEESVTEGFADEVG